MPNERKKPEGDDSATENKPVKLFDHKYGVALGSSDRLALEKACTTCTGILFYTRTMDGHWCIGE